MNRTFLHFLNSLENQSNLSLLESIFKGYSIIFESTDITSQEFKEWFQGSKIVSENGTPLKVWHGTDQGDFDTFETPAYFSESKGEACMYANEDSGYYSTRAKKVKATISDEEIKNLEDGISERDSEWWEIGKWYAVGDYIARKTENNTLEAIEGIRIKFNWTTNTFEKIPLGKPKQCKVNAYYLSIKNPKKLDIKQGNKLAGAGNQRGKANKELIQNIIKEGYDGVITPSDFSLAMNFVAFYPEQIKLI